MPPMPSVLVAQVRGGSRSVNRLSGGTSLGSSLGAFSGADAAGAPTESWSIAANAVTEFNGDLYIVHHETTTAVNIYKRTALNTWTLVHTLVVVSATWPGNVGLHVVNTGNIRYLATIHIANGTVYMARSVDGTTWTNHNLGAHAVAQICRFATVYRGQILFASSTSILLVNVATATFSTIAHTFGSIRGASICVFKNRIFMHATGSTNVPAQLYEISAGSLVQRVNLSWVGLGPGNTAGQNQPVLFPVKDASFTGGEKLVCIFLDYGVNHNLNPHWQAAEIDVDGSNFTSTLRSNLIPTPYRYLGAQGNKQDIGWGVFIDNESDPANPRTYLFSWTDTNAAFTHYEYVDSTSELVSQALGLNSSNFALAFSNVGGGERIHSSDDAGDELTITKLEFSKGTSPGTTLVTVRVAGDAGDASKVLKGYFSTFESPIMSQMTLTGSATGGSAVRNGNQIEGIDADNATDYTFLWNSVGADGLSVNQPVHAMVRVEH